MGTRNFIMVIDQEGNKKVAQYGQWDGYPEGQGAKVLSFLQDKDLMGKFINNLPKVRFLDAEGKDKQFIEDYNKNTPNWSNEPDNRAKEQKRWWSTYMSRDLSADILTNIATSTDNEILVGDAEEGCKGGDSWIEWSYVVNLKDKTFSVYSTIDNPPIATFELDNLPTNEDFVKRFEEEEEEE